MAPVHTLGAAPSSLTDVEALANSSAVRLTRLRVNKALLGLDDGCLTLVVHTQHLTPDLELAAFACYRKRLEELYPALSVENMLGVELGYALDGLGVAARIEVDDFLVCMLEWKNDGVGREGSKGRMEFLSLLLEL